MFLRPDYISQLNFFFSRGEEEGKHILFLPISQAFCRSRRNEQHWVKGLISRHWSKVPIYNERVRGGERETPSARRNYGWVVVLTSWANSGKSKVDEAGGGGGGGGGGRKGGKGGGRGGGGHAGRRASGFSARPACISRRPAIDLGAPLARMGEISRSLPPIRGNWSGIRDNSNVFRTIAKLCSCGNWSRAPRVIVAREYARRDGNASEIATVGYLSRSQLN